MQDRTIAAEMGAGYRRVPGPLMDFRPLSNWVVVQEKLFDDTSSHLVLLRKGNSVLGTVLAAGHDAVREHNLRPGDMVFYDEWHGGRWYFVDPNVDGGQIRCLILRADHCQVRILREEAPTTRIT